MGFKGWDRSLWTKSYPQTWYKEGYAQGRASTWRHHVEGVREFGANR